MQSGAHPGQHVIGTMLIHSGHDLSVNQHGASCRRTRRKAKRFDQPVVPPRRPKGYREQEEGITRGNHLDIRRRHFLPQ